MTLEKETMNLNCSVTQIFFVPSTILSFSSIPLSPRAMAIMGRCTEMLHPSPNLCKTIEVENRQASTPLLGGLPHGKSKIPLGWGGTQYKEWCYLKRKA